VAVLVNDRHPVLGRDPGNHKFIRLGEHAFPKAIIGESMVTTNNRQVVGSVPGGPFQKVRKHCIGKQKRQ
jgi:hypothetical protein